MALLKVWHSENSVIIIGGEKRPKENGTTMKNTQEKLTICVLDIRSNWETFLHQIDDSTVELSIAANIGLFHVFNLSTLVPEYN